MTEIIKNAEYQWNPGFHNSVAHTNIELVIQELKDIEDVHGKVTPDLIVQSAKNKKSVIHNYFNWDDANAAARFRLQQASTLLRHIQIKVIKDGESMYVRVYETLNRPTVQNTSPEFKRVDLINSDDVIRIKRIIISDLNRIKSKMEMYDIKEGYLSISKAIEELSKESTETKAEEIKSVVLEAV